MVGDGVGVGVGVGVGGGGWVDVVGGVRVDFWLDYGSGQAHCKGEEESHREDDGLHCVCSVLARWLVVVLVPVVIVVCEKCHGSGEGTGWFNWGSRLT